MIVVQIFFYKLNCIDRIFSQNQFEFELCQRGHRQRNCHLECTEASLSANSVMVVNQGFVVVCRQPCTGFCVSFSTVLWIRQHQTYLPFIVRGDRSHPCCDQDASWWVLLGHITIQALHPDQSFPQKQCIEVNYFKSVNSIFHPPEPPLRHTTKYCSSV